MKRRVRRTRDEQPVVQEPWRPGLLHLVAIAILLSLIAAFLRSNQGLLLGLSGAFVWVAAFLIAFGLGLVHNAPYLLPPEADEQHIEGWEEGLRMLTYHFTVMMLPDNLRGRYHRPRSDVPPQLSDSFAEFQAGFVPSHLAVILRRGATVGRAAGPGYVRLQRGERIIDLLDLRRQVRRRDVQAYTHDGIPLSTSIAVTFRVRDPASSAPPDIPYPFDRQAVYRLTYSDGVGDGVGGEAEIPWSERISAQAATLLVAAIARRRLDHFYRPLPGPPEVPAATTTDATDTADGDGSSVHTTTGAGGPESEPPSDALALNELVREVKGELASSLEDLFACRNADNCPITIHAISISHLQPPPEVIDQRIRNWQSAWERRKIMARAENAAFEISEMQRVRGDTLRKLILDVTYNVARMANGDRDAIRKVLMVRIAEMIDRLIGDQRVKIQTPQEVFEALSKARHLLRDAAGEGQQ